MVANGILPNLIFHFGISSFHLLSVETYIFQGIVQCFFLPLYLDFRCVLILHKSIFCYRIKTKKTQYRLYDYTYIALWDSTSFRPTAFRLVNKYITIKCNVQVFFYIKYPTKTGDIRCCVSIGFLLLFRPRSWMPYFSAILTPPSLPKM